MTAIDDAELVVVTGKGGTGRTTVAAALGLAAAARGRRTIVCEVGGQSHVAALLGGGRNARPEGEVPSRVSAQRAEPAWRTPPPGVETPVGDGLWTTTIDPDSALEEWLTHQLPRRLVLPLARSGVFSGFVAAAPGARELVTITKAWELGQAQRWSRNAHGYDTVILDAPASGHGLGLLRTPRTFADIARVGPIAGQARTVAEALADPARSRLVAVALPSELAVSETLELEGRVAATLGRDLDAIVVNGLWPRRLSGPDVAAVAAVDGAADHAVRRAVTAAAGRVRTQQGQLARLRRDAVAAVSTLPFVFGERLGAEEIRAFSSRLAASH